MAEDLSFQAEMNLLLNQRPFEPFVLTASSGERFEVNDRDQIVIGADAIMVVYPRGGISILRMRHLVAIHS